MFALPLGTFPVFMLTRRHRLVVRFGDVSAHKVGVEKAVAADPANPLITGEHVRPPFGALWVILWVRHNRSSKMSCRTSDRACHDIHSSKPLRVFERRRVGSLTTCSAHHSERGAGGSFHAPIWLKPAI